MAKRKTYEALVELEATLTDKLLRLAMRLSDVRRKRISKGKRDSDGPAPPCECGHGFLLHQKTRGGAHRTRALCFATATGANSFAGVCTCEHYRPAGRATNAASIRRPTADELHDALETIAAPPAPEAHTTCKHTRSLQ